MSLIIPENYHSKLTIRETEAAIKMIKDKFELSLSQNLSLSRISAPLFVFPETGLNDDLNGVERPVSFSVKNLDERSVDIVHSLAKWKRVALKKYHFLEGEGIYTDMNAIRRDDDLDNIHSIYVDQWDWEKIIAHSQRTINTLEESVTQIYCALKEAEGFIINKFPTLEAFLPNKVTFIASQQLLSRYPHMSTKQREDAVCKEFGAVFITQIGCTLSNGEKHDGRAPDYDDWQLNGDLLLWYPPLMRSIEISSMGIRVDECSLLSQLECANQLFKQTMPYHQSVLDKQLPYTIGGGIGQSRLCMFLLNKAHIGEVQASVWSDEMLSICSKHSIHLL